MLDDVETLSGLAPFADDAAFRQRFAAVKRANKERLAGIIANQTGMKIDPAGDVRRAGEAHPRI